VTVLDGAALDRHRAENVGSTGRLISDESCGTVCSDCLGSLASLPNRLAAGGVGITENLCGGRQDKKQGKRGRAEETKNTGEQGP